MKDGVQLPVRSLFQPGRQPNTVGRAALLMRFSFIGDEGSNPSPSALGKLSVVSNQPERMREPVRLRSREAVTACRDRFAKVTPSQRLEAAPFCRHFAAAHVMIGGTWADA